MSKCGKCDKTATMENEEGDKLCFSCYCDMTESWYEIEETEQ